MTKWMDYPKGTEKLTGKARQELLAKHLEAWVGKNSSGGEHQKAARAMQQSGYTQPDVVDDILSRLAKGTRNG